MTRDDNLRERIRRTAEMARIQAEHAIAQERAAELQDGAHTPEWLLVVVNHRASAIGWTTVATTLESLLD
jgi:hypothetical protein